MGAHNITKKGKWVSTAQECFHFSFVFSLRSPKGFLGDLEDLLEFFDNALPFAVSLCWVKNTIFAYRFFRAAFRLLMWDLGKKGVDAKVDCIPRVLCLDGLPTAFECHWKSFTNKQYEWIIPIVLYGYLGGGAGAAWCWYLEPCWP